MQGLISTKGYGRKILIEFKCTRCGHTEIEDMDKCEKRTGDRGTNINQLRLPEGWYEPCLSQFALCPSCHLEYDRFLRNERGAVDD